MTRPTVQHPKTYFIRRGAKDVGPLSVQKLNQMRARKEIAPNDLCRSSDSTELHPLVALFPHLAEFNRKSTEQIQKEARTRDSYSMANSALVCGILAWFIAGLVLSCFAIVLGLKSWVRVRDFKGLIAVILGLGALAASLLNLIKPMGH